MFNNMQIIEVTVKLVVESPKLPSNATHKYTGRDLPLAWDRDCSQREGERDMPLAWDRETVVRERETCL